MKPKTTKIIEKGTVIKRKTCQNCNYQFFGIIENRCPKCGYLIIINNKKSA